MNAIELFNRGYSDLISVTPPGANLSPGSAIREQDLGKVPGVMNGDGCYHGYDWRKAPSPTHAEVESWMRHKSNVGLRADYFPGIDIDCTNVALSNLIRSLAITHLGTAPERVGRAPKRLLVYKTTEPFRRMRLWITEPGGTKHLIEALGDGQQFVVAGIHPVTKKPYEWPHGLLDAEDLTEITRDEIDQWFDTVAEALDAFGCECVREGSGALARERAEIDQQLLRGEASKVCAALEYLPNTNELFPARQDYLKMGYSVKAALGDDGYALFEKWALSWEGNDTHAGNEPETVYSDWQRMQPPYEVGANWLYEMAQKNGYDWAADEFEADETITAPDDAELSVEDFAAAVAAQRVPGDDDGDRPGKINQYGPYSDLDMAERFVKLRGSSVRYCEEMGKWLAWDGMRWSVSGTGRVRYLVSKLCADAQREALGRIADPKESKAVRNALGSNGKKNAITDYASNMPAINIEVTALDAHPDLLNTPAGVINLRTGERSDADPALLQTKMTRVAPEYGEAVVWEKFLHDVTGGDADMIEYLQRVAGYALTGDKSLHSLHFFYGPGGNGKGTFLNTLRAVWGDYGKAANMDLFTSARFDKHPTELAGLAGSRLVIANETDDDRSWDEAKLKQLTANDPVSARFMAKDFFEFMPTFKLLFSGNHRPSIKNVDAAMRRRIHIVPFDYTPTNPDSSLGSRLEAEYPQILRWAIEGAKKFYADGELRDPDKVHEATDEYFEHEDDFSQWLRERVDLSDKNAIALCASLVDDYQQWAASNGGQRRSAKALSGMLTDRGFKRVRAGGSGARGFLGIRLTCEPGDEFKTDPDLA